MHGSVEAGDAIRRRRMYLGLTATALAEKAGVDRTVISALEKGRAGCSGRTLVQLGDALGWADTQLGYVSRLLWRPQP